MPDHSSPQPVSSAPRWFVWLGLIAFGVYAVLIGAHSTVAAGGSDSSGYLNSGKLLASGLLDIPVRLPSGFTGDAVVSLSHFQPLGFVGSHEGARLVPTYPTGLPLHFAAAGKVLGWTWGPRCVELAGALAALWLCYAVGRELGLARPLAAAAAIVLAACPLVLFAAMQPLSDLLATTWCLAAVWAALRARRHPGWAAACGAAYGVAVLVRPTNILLLPALVVLLGLDWRRLALAALGGLPCAGWLAFYNHTVYGGALRSGYLNWSEFFALRYLKPAAAYFLEWLAVFVPTAMLALPLAALCRRDTRTRELLALALWFAPITGLYLFVAFSHESWTCLRYLLPALPALILAAMLGIEALARGSGPTLAPRIRLASAVVLAAWAIGVSWFWSPRNLVFHLKQQEDAYITSAHAARAHFSENTLVLSCHTTGALYHYTDFPVLRYDAVSPEEFARYVALAQRTGVTIAALLFTAEEQMALRERCPGEWIRLATVDGVDLWRLAAASPVAQTK